MKKKVSKKEKEVDDSIRYIVDEMHMNLHELVGRFVSNSQVLEAQLKSYIARVDKKITLKSLEARRPKATLGILIGMFKARYKPGLLLPREEQLLMEWLQSVLELRNDVAHEYFIYDAMSRKKIGDDIHALNKKLIRKGLRMTEFCIHQLDAILKGQRSRRVRKIPKKSNKK